MVASSPLPTTFRLPDLWSHCPFPLTYHPKGDDINIISATWFEQGCSDFTEKKRRHLNGLKAGVLSAYIYHDTDEEHLRIISDFMNYLFLLDDLSDGLSPEDNCALTDAVMSALEFPHFYLRTLSDGRMLPEVEPDAGKMARDFWSRCIQDAGPGFQTRFKRSMTLYLESVTSQAVQREGKFIPHLDTYIDARRDNSGLWPLMDALEYTLRIDLPDYVVQNATIIFLRQCVNDYVAWSNDIFSYNTEQVRGDTYNMVAILMKYHCMDLQAAVDRVADMCRETIDNFCKSKAEIPSWSPQVDKDVTRYVHGLENWMAGSLQWSFTTERYFGSDAANMKQTRVVKIVSRRPSRNAD